MQIEICDKEECSVCQAISDIIESVALQQAGVSHILNAEGEKLQKVIAMPNVTAEEMLEVNKSVKNMIDIISMLEIVLKRKLSLLKQELCKNLDDAL